MAKFIVRAPGKKVEPAKVEKQETVTKENFVKNKNILVWDYGLFTEQAKKFADAGAANVWYFVPWASAFPKSNSAIIGEGIEGLTRILDFWDYVDKADLIYFPDTHCGDIVEYLKEHEYPVAGVGKAEELELDRWLGRQVQKDVGLPTQETVKLKGLKELDSYLKNNENKFVKFNIFRGEIESFFHSDYESSKPMIDHLAYEFGPKQDIIEFVVEEKIDGFEPGIDCITYNGETLSPTMYGFEMKGAGYICSVMDYKDIPEPIRKVNDGLSSKFKEYGTKFFFSSEVRVDDKGKGYMIDYTLRHAAPATSAIQCELIENFTDIIWGFAHNIKVIPKYSHKYAGGVAFESEWADKHWLKISFPEKLRQWVKLRMGAKFGEDYYACPGFTSACTIIALGDSPEEVLKLLKERAEEVKGYLLDKNTGGLDEIIEEIDNWCDCGYKF